jgi:hypothetical protein
MKTTFLLAALIASAALFVACGSDKDKPAMPAQASVLGDATNVCPATTVVLTARATNATSFAWYNGSEKINGATGATCAVSVTGTYYAAGVNDVGEGAKSEAKAVTISPCEGGIYYGDLLGTYHAGGVPSWLIESGPSSWASTVTMPEDESYYALSNFGGYDIDVWIDYTNGGLIIDNYSEVAWTQEEDYVGYFFAAYTDGEYIYWLDRYEVSWNNSTRVLDFSGKYEGHDILVGVLAFEVATGEAGGVFTDLYTDLKFTKTASGAPAFSGTKVKTTPIQGSRLRTLDNIKGAVKVRFDPAKFSREETNISLQE